MFLTAEHFNDKTINSFADKWKIPKGISLLRITYFFSVKKIDFYKKITPAGDVIILLVSEMPVPVFAVGKHFPLKIPFPRCDMRRNQQL